MKKRDVLRGFFLFLSLVDMAVIFWFSSQSGIESGHTGTRLAENLLSILYRGFNGLEAAAREQVLGTTSGILRITAHFGEFLLLGLFVCSFLNTYDLSKRKLLLYSMAFCVLYAVSDEIHQLFVPDRAFEFLDILVDAAGCFAGLLIFRLFNYIIKNKRRKIAASKGLYK